MVKRAFAKLEKDIIRRRIAVEKRRPDGRATDEVRPITCEVGVDPAHARQRPVHARPDAGHDPAHAGRHRRVPAHRRPRHRGVKKRYMHHYNFPPFSVGETGFMRGPKRRDIGHGALAERALLPMLPDEDEFPYTIRLVSEILESNGSSSMASVCGSTLSLMDAGVQIKAPVAGIAMGLIKEGDAYVVLTDIAGVEDHLGDMDFKVAGTADGITALQMDIKISGVTFEILAEALEQARRGRLFILGKMLETLAEPRSELSRVRAAHLQHPDQPRPDRPHHRQGRRDHQGHVRGVRRRHRRPGRRHHLHLRPRPGVGEGVIERIQSMTKEIEVGDVVHRPRGQDHRLRRLRRAQEGHRRPAPHLAAGAQGRAREVGRGCRQARRHGDRRGRRDRQGAQPHRAQAAQGPRQTTS